MNNDKFKFYKRIEKMKRFVANNSYFPRLKFRSKTNKLTLSYLFIDRNIYRHTNKKLYMKRSFKHYKYFSDDFKSFTDYIQFTSDPNYNEFFDEYYPNVRLTTYKDGGRIIDV